MAISINWGTKVIYVPQSFLTPIGGTSYSLDTFAFHTALRELEMSEEGSVFDPTHNHNTVVTLGGIQYARIIEIINGYSITFEDGNYSVSLIGSNNNILDVTNLNQVSIRANNSAGLINVSEVQQIVFDGAVHLDTVNGSAGTLYPKGTPLTPVNNISDALAIASARGITNIEVQSNLTIPTGTNITGITFRSDFYPEITLESGVVMENATFKRISLYGECDALWTTLIDCWVYSLTNFAGWMRGGSFETISLAPFNAYSNGQSYFDDLVPMYPGIPSTLTMGLNTSVSFTNSSDITAIEGMTAGSNIFAGLNGGDIHLMATCTGGDVIISGEGAYTNMSSTTVDDTGLVVTLGTHSAASGPTAAEIATAVWNKTLP